MKREKIKGKTYITFHPNTIVYAVPTDSLKAKELLKSKIGIVWHTTYTGKSFETMKASYGVDVSKLNKTANVWSQDAMLRDLTNYTMSKKETEIVNDYLSEAGKLFNQISGNVLRDLEKNQSLAQTIETFNNSFVRRGMVIANTQKHVNALIRYIKNKYQKEIDSRKTEKGKQVQKGKLNEVLKFFSEKNKVNLKKIFDLQKLIVLAKLKIINILNKFIKLDTFVQTSNGFKTTGQEGFVAIDKLGGDAVKIVDRLEFSYNNFNPSILKGWNKPTRT